MTEATGLATLLGAITQVLQMVITSVGSLVTMVMANGNEILLLPWLLGLIAFAVGVFMHFARA